MHISKRWIRDPSLQIPLPLRRRKIMSAKTWIATHILGIDPAKIAEQAALAENAAVLAAAQTIVPGFDKTVNDAAKAAKTQVRHGETLVKQGKTEIAAGTETLSYAQRLGTKVTLVPPEQPK